MRARGSSRTSSSTTTIRRSTSTYTRRKHRWIRGDWQLLPWLRRAFPGPTGSEPNRLSLLSQWKIFDNLRRSVVETVAAAVRSRDGWLPGSRVRWTVLALLAVAAPWVIALAWRSCRPPFDKSWRAYYAAVGRDALASAEQVVLAIAFLPHQAWISVDAIARTVCRLAVSQRRLLEWQPRPAGRTARVEPAGRDAGSHAASVASVIGLAVVAAIGTGAASDCGRPAPPGLLPLAWRGELSCRGCWHRCSRPAQRAVAIDPHARCPSAPRAEAMRYAQHALGVLRPVRHRGDALARAGQLPGGPGAGRGDANVADQHRPAAALHASAHTISGFIAVEEMAHAARADDRTIEQLRRYRGHLYNWYDLHDLRVLEPPYITTVDSGNFAGHLIALRQACSALAARAAELRARDCWRWPTGRTTWPSRWISRSCTTSDRKLFTIGYQPRPTRRTRRSTTCWRPKRGSRASSPSRKNDVPVEHWFRLSAVPEPAVGRDRAGVVERQHVRVPDAAAGHALVAVHAARADVSERGGAAEAYARARGVPWGTSESAYNLRDRHQTYQYRAFGVPDLALKRGLGRDLVSRRTPRRWPRWWTRPALWRICAGSSVWARSASTGSVMRIDYTRPAPGSRFAIVHAYMAHHIGMTLVSLTNVLRDDLWQDRFHADPLVKSVELLLHERVPRRLAVQAAQTARADEAQPAPDRDRPVVREIEHAWARPAPRVALLGSRPYTVMLNHSGGGYSQYESLAVTRWRADGTRGRRRSVLLHP